MMLSANKFLAALALLVVVALPGAAVYANTTAEYAHELVGTWAWVDGETYTYNFRSDGTGRRGVWQLQVSFTWSTAGNELIIIRDNDIYEESWTFSISDNILTLDSRQIAGLTFCYIQVPEQQELSPSFPERGTWHGNIYENEQLGFRLVLPDGWYTENYYRLHENLQYMSEFIEDTWDAFMNIGSWHFELDAFVYDGPSIRILYYGLPPWDMHISTVVYMLEFIQSVENSVGPGAGTEFLGIARIGNYDWFVHETTSAMTDISGTLGYTRVFINVHDGIIRMISFGNSTGLVYFDEMLAMFVNLDGTAPEIIPFEFEHAPEVLGTWAWDGDSEFIYNFYSDGTGRRGGGDYALETFTWMTHGSCVLLILDGEPLLFGVPRELWSFDVSGDILTLDSRQAVGLVYSYICQNPKSKL